jgi:hypothetical protein
MGAKGVAMSGSSSKVLNAVVEKMPWPPGDLADLLRGLDLFQGSYIWFGCFQPFSDQGVSTLPCLFMTIICYGPGMVLAWKDTALP